MVKITGAREHVSHALSLTGPEAVREVGRALFVAGGMIQTEAQISITTGAVSGKNHVPSKPGEPPKQDTGVLAGNIETNQTSPLSVEVSSNAPYAAHLEFGTSKMAERPYMRPAVAKVKDDIARLVARAVTKVLRKG